MIYEPAIPRRSFYCGHLSYISCAQMPPRCDLELGTQPTPVFQGHWLIVKLSCLPQIANSASLLRKLSSSILIGTVDLLNEKKLAVPSNSRCAWCFFPPKHVSYNCIQIPTGLWFVCCNWHTPYTKPTTHKYYPTKTSTQLTFLYSIPLRNQCPLSQLNMPILSIPPVPNISMPALGRHALLQVVLLPASPPPEVSNLGYKRVISADPLRKSLPTLPTVWPRMVRFFRLSASENILT